MRLPKTSHHLKSAIRDEMKHEVVFVMWVTLKLNSRLSHVGMRRNEVVLWKMFNFRRSLSSVLQLARVISEIFLVHCIAEMLLERK